MHFPRTSLHIPNEFINGDLTIYLKIPKVLGYYFTSIQSTHICVEHV